MKDGFISVKLYAILMMRQKMPHDEVGPFFAMIAEC